MAELAPLLTAGGGLGVLGIVIAYLLGSNRADRKQLGEQIDDAERRADKAEARAAELNDQLDKALVRARAAEAREAEAILDLARERAQREHRRGPVM